MRGALLLILVALAAVARAAEPRHHHRPAPESHAAAAVAHLRAALQAQETEAGLRIRLPADKVFGEARDELSPQAMAPLHDAAQLIALTRPHHVVVAGHTDGLGADDENMRLSQARAHAIAAWLATHCGAAHPVFVEEGFGRTRPVAPNTKPDGSDDPDARALNRRIEIILRR